MRVCSSNDTGSSFGDFFVKGYKERTVNRHVSWCCRAAFAMRALRADVLDVRHNGDEGTAAGQPQAALKGGERAVFLLFRFSGLSTFRFFVFLFFFLLLFFPPDFFVHVFCFLPFCCRFCCFCFFCSFFGFHCFPSFVRFFVFFFSVSLCFPFFCLSFFLPVFFLPSLLFFCFLFSGFVFPPSFNSVVFFPSCTAFRLFIDKLIFLSDFRFRSCWARFILSLYRLVVVVVFCGDGSYCRMLRYLLVQQATAAAVE